MQCIQTISIRAVQLFQLLKKSNSLCCIIRIHLTDQERTIDRILITHITSGKIPIALLKTKDIGFLFSLCFQETNLFPDEFETGQYIDRAYAIMCRNTLRHVNRNYGFHHNRILRHAPHRNPS